MHPVSSERVIWTLSNSICLVFLLQLTTGRNSPSEILNFQMDVVISRELVSGTFRERSLNHLVTCVVTCEVSRLPRSKAQFFFMFELIFGKFQREGGTVEGMTYEDTQFPPRKKCIIERNLTPLIKFD